MSDWYIYQKKADFKHISEKFNISPMLARIIRNRDIVGDEAVDDFLNGDIRSMYDPFLFEGMKKAVDIIIKTISNKEKVCIMGDYDIDGISSCYMLKKFLKNLGGNVTGMIPDRISDGYGMNPGMVKRAYDDGVKLIITCDNGISAFEAVKTAKELDMTVIVTDHHQIPEMLPEADVILNPHMKDCGYPFADLCGAGVAYKVCKALDPENHLLDEMLMFAGFATIGDIVPLVGENRIFAKEGLKRLNACTNTGMNALIEECAIKDKEMDSYHVGFILGPCINSAGRLKTADLSLKLFESMDMNEALTIAHELRTLNDERKKLTDEQIRAAKEQLKKKAESGEGIDNIIVLHLPDAHESIAGIVAGRIREEYNRPVFVVTKGDKGLKGSGRSTQNYNMIEEISKIPECFEKFGGHAMACGFSLASDDIEEFRIRINRNLSIPMEKLHDKQWIDMQLPLEYVSEQFINELDMLKPFGAANQKPVFAGSKLKVYEIRVMGKNQNALKLKLEGDKGYIIDGILFGDTDSVLELSEMLINEKEKNAGLTVNIIYYPQINEFRGFKTPQLVIKDLKVI